MTTLKSVANYVKSNLGVIGAGVGGVALGAGVGYIAGRKSSRKKRRRANRKMARKKRYSSGSRRQRIRRTPRTAGKRKDTSHRRIRYTRKGQPYIITGSGKAKFIKKRGARVAHKRRGGRY